MNYYTVKLPDDRTIMHVKAKTKAAARNCALAGVEVVRLTTDDVLDLHERGIGIVQADRPAPPPNPPADDAE